MRDIFIRRPAHGFTLIEMLAVILIMGILVGLVKVITRPDSRSLLRIEAERLAQLVDLAATEAGFTDKTIAWTADETGYRFWSHRDESGWSEIRDNDLLRERALPPGMTVSGLQIENMPPNGRMRLEFAPYAPPLFFTIELSMGSEHYIVASSAGGVVRASAVDGLSYGAPAL
jgi:general secretion pathway protein H